MFRGSSNPPSVPQLQEDSRNSQKVNVLWVTVITGKVESLDSDRRRSTQGRDHERGQMLSFQVCSSYSHRHITSPTLTVTERVGDRQPGQLPWALVFRISRLWSVGMVDCPHDWPPSPAPLGGELCAPHLPPPPHCWSAPRLNHIVTLSGMTLRQTKTLLASTTFQGFRYFLPKARGRVGTAL